MLYFVATPIGNLEDITLRAIRVLSEADVIAAEDTRRALKLLNHIGVKKPLISLYRENERSRSSELIERAKTGNVSVISDAGMPLISDPGEFLLSEAVRLGVAVTVVPGASASLMALALSALPAERFAFEGFLPRESKPLRLRLSFLAAEQRTIIFYESPLRLKSTLSSLYAAFGDRRAAVLRELTKLHEEAVRAPLSELVAYYETPPKGECVIVVEGASVADIDETIPEEELKTRLKALLDEGLSRSDAARKLAAELNVPKNTLYRLSLL